MGHAHCYFNNDRIIKHLGRSVNICCVHLRPKFAAKKSGNNLGLGNIPFRTNELMVSAAGFEPATHALKGLAARKISNLHGIATNCYGVPRKRRQTRVLGSFARLCVCSVTLSRVWWWAQNWAHLSRVPLSKMSSTPRLPGGATLARALDPHKSRSRILSKRLMSGGTYATLEYRDSEKWALVRLYGGDPLCLSTNRTGPP